jgi:hypothetical protein
MDFFIISLLLCQLHAVTGKVALSRNAGQALVDNADFDIEIGEERLQH